jgi:hypothetical protein
LTSLSLARFAATRFSPTSGCLWHRTSFSARSAAEYSTRWVAGNPSAWDERGVPPRDTLGPMPSKRALPRQAVGFIETMDCLPVPKLPDGPEWTYEILCSGSHKISCVAQEVMLRDSSGSAHREDPVWSTCEAYQSTPKAQLAAAVDLDSRGRSLERVDTRFPAREPERRWRDAVLHVHPT